jgi:hypothetical protein
MYNKYIIIKELLIWIVSLAISYALLFPIISHIDYNFFAFNMTTTTLGIQFFRWIVFFDFNLLFKNSWIKFLSLLVLSVFGMMIIIKTQEIILLLENQELSDLTNTKTIKTNMSLTEIYNFYRYLFNYLIFTSYCTAGLAAILNIRIVASYIGYKSDALKKYLKTVK